MHTNIIKLFMVALLTMLVTGCSSDSSNPIAPVNEGNTDNDGVPIIGLSHADDMFNAVGIMGAYDFYLNPETLEVEMTQSRKVSIGEDFIVSGMAYWTIVPCGDCLKVDGIVPDGDYFKVTFEINHPFEPGNPAEPPSGKNRLDLDIFDVALVIAPNGATSHFFPLTNSYAYADFCAMADGYTPELANLTGDPAVLPYYLVVDNSDLGVSTWNEFPMGAVDSFFDVFFDTGGRFRLYLTFGYGVSATFHTRFDPKYYNPEFNRKAAWKVEVTPPNGNDPPTMLNTWNNLDTASFFDITVEVYDWQIGATVYADPLHFGDAPTDNIFAASNVSEVSLEIPGMFSPLETMDTEDQGTGAPGDPLKYTFSVANENGLGAGTYTGLVCVMDERMPLTVADMRDFLVHTPLGTERFNYIIPEYATYQTFPAVIVTGCGPITGSINTPTCPLTGVMDDGMVSFSATAASANGGDPIVYEWDMDYDGASFDVDATGPSVILGPYDNPSCGTPGYAPLDFTIAVRATDNCTPPNVTIFAECVITVDNCDSRPIYSINFVEKPAADIWWDVCVMPNASVFVCADHDATSNTDGNCEDGLRTALRFDNDLGNMAVMNEVDGMAAPYPGAREWLTDWQRIDVSLGGSIITSQCGAGIGTWSVSGTTATSEACCWAYACSAGSSPVPDVADHVTATYGIGIVSFGKTNDGCVPDVNWSLGFTDTELVDFSGYNTDAIATYPIPDYLTNQVGLEGIDGTDDIMIFYSSATEGKISIWGDAYSTAGDATEIDFTGSIGTGPGEFTGGLDFSIDSAGNIVTIEDNGGGVYRFQKFTSDLVFIYEHEWDGTDAPMRVDFDKGDNTLYMLTDDGVHVLFVN